MAMKKIPSVEQSLISASMYINNFKRAIEELVYNSIDAASSSIAIRVVIEDGFIQVLDNGNGILKDDFNLLGLKYATSKYHNIDVTTLRSAPDKYGFRGLSLANIIHVAKNVTISSRQEKSEDTFLKIFNNGKENEICKTISRPSRGTTVEIKGFLHNLNIQRQSIDPQNELHNIKTALQQLSLVHTSVSISLRDNSKNDIIFQIHKNRNIYKTLWTLFQINEIDCQEFQVEKNEYKVKAFIGKNTLESNKIYQWIYLNGKFINKSTLHRKLNENFTLLLKTRNNDKRKNKHANGYDDNYFYCNIPFYFIFLSCPNYDFDITYKSEKTLIEFKDWKEIYKLIEKLVQFYCGGITLIPQNKEIEKVGSNEKKSTTRTEIKDIMEKILSNKNKQPKISQLQNGVKGKISKRNQKKKRNTLKQKSFNKCLETEDLCQVKQISRFSKLEKIKNQPNMNPYPVHLNIPEEVKDFETRKNVKQNYGNLYYDNFLIGKFNAQTKTVRKRCKRLNRQVEKLKDKCFNIFKDYVITNNINDKTLHQNVIEKAETISLRKIGNNIEKTKCATKNCQIVKKSYDLIRTVDYSEYKRPAITSIVPENKYSYFNQYKQHYKIKPHETLISMATYNSHIHNLEEKKVQTKHFISETSCNNFFLQKQELPLMANKNISKNTKILNKEKKYIRRKTSRCNFLNKFNQELQEFSYTIEMNNSHEIINGRNDTFNASTKHDIINTQSRGNHMLQSYDHTESLCFGNTYTFENAMRPSHNNQLNKTFLLKTFNTHSISSRYFEETSTSIIKETVDRSSNTSGKEKKSKNLTILSEAKPYNKEITFNNIDILNFCEAVLGNSNESQNFENEFKNSIKNIENRTDHKTISKSGNNSLKQTSFESFRNVNTTKSSGPIDNNYSCEEILPNIASHLSQNIELHKSNKQDIQIDKIEVDCDRNFQLNSRHHFIPKGMSPITKNKYPQSTYTFNADEIYYKDVIYEKFADDILVNSEIFEPGVQNVKNLFSKDIEKVNVEVKNKCADLIFDPLSLRQAKVLAQVDRKFVATVLNGMSQYHDKSSEFLVLFDQHAVDERIRLESNLKDYVQDGIWESIDLEPISLILSKDDYFYLLQHKNKLNQLGLQWTFKDDNEILLNAIPKAMLGQHARQVELVIKAVKKLIFEQIEAIKSLRGNISLYPKSIMELVFSEACRYAIKFGDRLSKNDCITLIKYLSYCKTPFQCAHGRPVMAVVMELKNNRHNYTVNLRSIKKFKKSL